MSMLANRFVLQTELARGAVGVVWRGLDQVTGDPVAIKVLREELRGEPEIVESFFAEAEVLNTLDHPGVVGVRDFIVTDAVLAIVLELADGPDLREHLRLHGPLAPAEAARRCAFAAETLAAVHRAGYLHGDVKPGNLMLSGAEAVTFIDFGIARPAGSTSTPSHGTPEYTAPEVAAGESACPGIDHYALGLVLYEALTGRSAYRGGSITEVLERHLTRIPVKPAGVDTGLWRIVETLLSLDPGRRGDLDQLAAELRRLAPGLSDRATAVIDPQMRDRAAPAAAHASPLTPPVPAVAAVSDPSGAERPGRRGLVLAGAAAGAIALVAVAAFVLFLLPGAGQDDEDVADPSSPSAESSAESSETDDDPAEGSVESDGEVPAESDTEETDPESADPESEAPETDSDPVEPESDGLSDSEEGESNEGGSVEEAPGADMIGSPMPGN